MCFKNMSVQNMFTKFMANYLTKTFHGLLFKSFALRKSTPSLMNLMFVLGK